jgi:hypothetical protein
VSDCSALNSISVPSSNETIGSERFGSGAAQAAQVFQASDLMLAAELDLVSDPRFAVPGRQAGPDGPLESIPVVWTHKVYSESVPKNSTPPRRSSCMFQ